MIETSVMITSESLVNELFKSKKNLIASKRIMDKKDRHVYPINDFPFEIPANWQWVYLSDISIIQEGPGIRKHQYQDDGIQFLTVTNILEGSVDLLKSQKYISLEEYEDKYQHFTINKGDIVTACSGASWGKSAIYEFDDKLILNTSTLRLRFFNDLGDNKYLYYLTKTDYFKANLASHSTGQQANYGYSHYSKIPIPIPPLQEQQQIVSILDEAFEAIDQAKANIEKNIENAKELFQSKLNDIFSQKGDGWEEKTWADVLEIKSGRNQKEVENPNGKYPILGSAGKVMNYADEYICEEGTTIIGRKGTINNPMYIETKFWNVDTAFGLHALEGLDKKFLYYFCKSYDFTQRDKGSGRPSLVKNDLMKIKMSIPQILIQKKLVEQCDRLVLNISELENNYQEKLDYLEELKKSILQKAFAGELN